MMDITRLKELEHLVMIKYKMDSLGRVATGIAHEIRNPLTGINSYLFTLQDLCGSDTIPPQNIAMIQRIAEQIQVASNRIEGVIKRVLDFSKPTAPKMLLVDINVPIREAINLSAVTLRKNVIKLEQDLTPDLPGCYGDVHLLEQVVLNLINNAANALRRHAGPKTIRIRSYAADHSVCIQVSDSGPGVSAELRDKIFDPFFTTSSDGSGIGLSIAQRIIADHNGTIRIGTSQWQGAEFLIELPVEKRMLPR
jgi:signal transduction histidine kinase